MKEFNDIEDLEQLLKPQCEFHASDTLKDEVIAKAKAEAGITEETSTWSGWKEAGFEVLHGSKALFAVDLIHGSKGDGANYRASFFGASQVRPLA